MTTTRFDATCVVEALADLAGLVGEDREFEALLAASGTLDHAYAVLIGDTPVGIASEPYEVDIERLASFAEWCHDHGLDVCVRGAARWHSKCLSIRVSLPSVSPTQWERVDAPVRGWPQEIGGEPW